MSDATHHDVYRARKGYWPPGLYRNEDGYQFEGEMDIDTFTDATVSVGCEEAPDLLLDLHRHKCLDLTAHPGIVAEAWSATEYPETRISSAKWLNLFRRVGYTHDGRPAAPPTGPVTLYRGCSPFRERGMSWTTSLAVAQRFATDPMHARLGGCVYSFDAPPRALLAYIHEIGRQESEYVVSNRFLKYGARLHEG